MNVKSTFPLFYSNNCRCVCRLQHIHKNHHMILHVLKKYIKREITQINKLS